MPLKKKHAKIKHYFFSGKGVELQYWDSQIAFEILCTLARHGVPCLPLHDSFIVSHPQADGLHEVMSESFYKVTGRYPNVDKKLSLIDLNHRLSITELEEEYQARMADGKYSDEFRQNFSSYVDGIEKWRQVTGKDNIFIYVQGKKFNKEIYT